MAIKMRKFRPPSLLEAAPYLQYEYSEDNILPFDQVSARSSTPCKWKCLKYGHQYVTRPSNRVQSGLGCPYCSGQRVSSLNSLQTKAPELESEYHPTKNVLPFAMVSYGSRKKVWWLCKPFEHEWQMSPKVRVLQKCGCPFCSGKRVSEHNSLALKAPELEDEYHPTKNTVPFCQLSYGSSKQRWWACKPHKHEWQASPSVRFLAGYGCPYCSGKRVSSLNSLATQAPWLAEEYHPTKNSVPFDQNSCGSDKERWWLCKPNKHEWEAAISNRVAGSGCPSCSNIHTKLEQVFEALLSENKWNKQAPGLPYRPDVKLSDSIYANADGLYWHSVQNKPSDYHFKMREAFEDKGLRLLQFYEDEIHQKPRIVRSMVDAILGKTPSRVMARKCSIKSVAQVEAQGFLEQNHIIGRVGWGCSFVGLYFDDNLVQLLATKRQGDVLEIVRSCGKIDAVVTGGFQRLLRHAIKTYRPRQVKTLIDLRYADGHSLVGAGFKLQKITINYEYTDNRTRKDKRAFRVKAGVDETKAAAEQGWYRIYNAGRARYVLDTTL